MSEEPVIVVGAGPAGMAAALALHRLGHAVRLLERHDEAHPAGSGLSLFAPVVKALRALGVDTADLGAPCDVVFQRSNGDVMARIKFPDQLAPYGGGFFGLLRPELYRRMAAALPSGMLEPQTAVTAIENRDDTVTVTLENGEKINTPLLIGADGINSLTRRTLWGQPAIREHNLHVICGSTFQMVPSAKRGLCACGFTSTIQASYSEILDAGRPGYQWWIVESWEPCQRPPDLHARAGMLAAQYGSPLTELVAASQPENITRWQIRDRKPLRRWSKGRVTLAGDAAHPTSPYAAYGPAWGSATAISWDRCSPAWIYTPATRSLRLSTDTRPTVCDTPPAR
jgi:2-polyprenyl-6-methoxyphenol hydroxylase-like FAD-dependent oxidoreductase